MTSSWGVALAASAILAIAGCHPAPKKAASSAQPPGSLCELVSYEDVTRALGAPPVGSTDTADAGNFNPGCSWMAQAAGGKPPHIMVFTVWKKTALVRQGSALTGRELYAHYVSDLSSLYTTIEPAYGVGDEATLGFNALNCPHRGASCRMPKVNGAFTRSKPVAASLREVTSASASSSSASSSLLRA